ncbi:secreted RxLR effector protein 161-like [Apium graveolens]|uniref:secreted RxLR effector protein 161-like n=1 Tax=Apium graveolens TaxID=4045 RepID=UPI003D7B4A9F
MEFEMESIYSNQVWELMEPPKCIKPIGFKWIYKKKRGSDKKVKAWKDSKKSNLPFRYGVSISKSQCPSTPKEIENMKGVLYVSAYGSLMYAMLCTRPDICFVVGMVSRYQSNPRHEYWSTVKIILKYLHRTKEYMLVYKSSDLLPLGYTDSDFQTDKNKRKSTSGCVFTLGGGAVIWRSVKQKCITDSTMETEYVAASEAVKEPIWFRNFLLDLVVVPNFPRQIIICCDNTGAVANNKEPWAHKEVKHI